MVVEQLDQETHLVEGGTLLLDIHCLTVTDILVPCAIAEGDAHDGADADRISVRGGIQVNLGNWAISRQFSSQGESRGTRRTKSVSRRTIELDQPLKPKTSFAMLMTEGHRGRQALSTELDVVGCTSRTTHPSSPQCT